MVHHLNLCHLICDILLIHFSVSYVQDIQLSFAEMQMVLEYSSYLCHLICDFLLIHFSVSPLFKTYNLVYNLLFILQTILGMICFLAVSLTLSAHLPKILNKLVALTISILLFKQTCCFNHFDTLV